VGELLALEEKKGLYVRQTFVEFARRVYAHRDALVAMLAAVKKSGKRIVGIGAPAKGNTLLNFCGITPATVDCILEKSALKIGLFTPGTHIPVVDETMLFKEQPEYALILAWNIAPELISKLRTSGYKGAFIIPFPSIHVV
jgi:sugar phosphate isomerase/epimerase